MVEQMYVQYFLPKHRKGKLPLLLWHGAGLTGVTYETTPDGREGWLNMFIRKGWDVYVSDAVERGRAGFASADVWPSEPIFLNYADPFERFRIGDGEGSWNADPAKAPGAAGKPVPGRGLRQLYEAGRATLALHRQGGRRRLRRAGGQGLPLRAAAAQPGRRVRLQGRGAAAGQGQGDRCGRVGDRRRRRQGGGAEEHAHADAVRRLCRPASPLGDVQENRYGICCRGARRRRNRRRDQPPRHRHQGQLAHADAGQEQCRDRRRHPDMDGREGLGRVTVFESSKSSGSEKRREGAMRRLGIVLAFSLAAGSALAQSKEPILLRDMGSFHVGGRVIEITGQPIKEIVFTPGGVPAKMDPNGKYQVEQMYVQYFLPQNRRGRLPLLMWHGGGLTGVTYETTPDGREGWLTYFIRKGWDTYISDAVERGRAGWTDTFKGEALSLPLGDPW